MGKRLDQLQKQGAECVDGRPVGELVARVGRARLYALAQMPKNLLEDPLALVLVLRKDDAQTAKRVGPQSLHDRPRRRARGLGLAASSRRRLMNEDRPDCEIHCVDNELITKGHVGLVDEPSDMRDRRACEVGNGGDGGVVEGRSVLLRLALGSRRSLVGDKPSEEVGTDLWGVSLRVALWAYSLQQDPR